MDQFFTELGRTVLARWKHRNFSLKAFPEIAQTAMEACPPAEHVDLPALIHEFLLEDEHPLQSESGFGQPELIVYDDPRFYIQILCWLDGTTDIHQHKFSGAFHVLEGSSLHSHFAFDRAQSVSAHLRVGHLRMTESQLLEKGSTVPIISGSDYIHSLFHLDTPSLTVVVRTHTDPGTGPQYTYLPPHLAIDPFHRDALTIRRKQLLDLLERTEDPGYSPLVLEMIESLDFERGFFILQNCLGHLRTLGAWEETLAAFERKHPSLGEFVAPTLDEIVRRDGLVEMRSAITESDHRFFLALLLNVPARADILRFVSERFPGPPLATILRWCEELASGSWLLDAEVPENIAAPVGQESEIFVEVLRHSLSPESGDGPCGVTSLSPADFARARERLLRSSFRVLVG